MTAAIPRRGAAPAPVSDAAAEFARRFEHHRDPEAAGSLAGVEHEFRVLDSAGAPVDFRTLLPRLPPGPPRLDPGDRNARRLPSGLALTADGAEAEIATPPVPVLRGFERHVAALAAEGRTTLAAMVPAGHTLEGYSTHVSLNVPGGDLDAFAHEYALVFGPAIAALGESPGSLGIYIRPRPGRLELCFDFAEGARLATVVAVAAGAVRALHERLPGLPAPLDATLLPARERFGYRLHRRAAFGFDTYPAGREAPLPLASGGITTLAARVRAAVSVAARALGPALEPGTARLLDELAAGRHALGIEGGELPDLPPAPGAPAFAAPRSWRRPRFAAEPCIATWDFTVYRLEGARVAFASVPRAAHPVFEAELARGDLDGLIERFLAAPAGSTALATRAQTAPAGLFDRVTTDPRALLPLERTPAHLHGTGAAAAKGGRESARPGKEDPGRPGKLWLPGMPKRDVTAEPADRGTVPVPPPPAPPPPRPARPRPWLMLAGAGAALAAVAGVAAMVLLTNGGGEAAPASPSPTSQQPSSTVAPSPAPPATATPSAADTTVPAGIPSPTAATTATFTAIPATTPTSTPPTSGPATATAQPTPTVPPSDTPPPTFTATSTPPATPTPVPSPTPTPTPPPAATPTAPPTPTRTATPAPTATPTATPAPPSIRNVTCATVDRNVPTTCQVFMGDTGLEATSFSWTAQGGTPATGTGTIFHPVFTTAGPHAVTVTACAGTACSTRTVSVTVL